MSNNCSCSNYSIDNTKIGINDEEVNNRVVKLSGFFLSKTFKFIDKLNSNKQYNHQFPIVMSTLLTTLALSYILNTHEHIFLTDYVFVTSYNMCIAYLKNRFVTPFLK